MTRFLMLLVMTCFMAGTEANATENTANVYVDNGELNYVGQISEKSNEQLFKLFDASPVKPRILSIRSKGGEVNAGMVLGTWLHEKQLTLKVLEYCFSSCANYVFTAAPKKIVSNFAVIGYHGGLSSTSFTQSDEIEKMLLSLPENARNQARAELDAQVKSGMADQIDAENRFFKLVGVQQKITTLGQAAEFAQRFDKDELAIGWTFSIDAFSRLGVTDITVINPPWKPAFIHSKSYVVNIENP